jgi:nucleotidyltransferase substrate binding protein (TIGR01987 family)
MNLDLSNLRKSIVSLKKSHSDYALAASTGQTIFLESLKSGAIQNFEITYELSWKFMKRWLEINVSPDIAFGIPKRDLFRLAGEYGMIRNVEDWFEYHKSRNETSHTYNESSATLAFEVSLRFIHDAESLLLFLEQKND